jgi:atypical dual specificity phosphatase
MRGYVAVPSALSIKHLQIDVDDLPFSELAAHLPRTTSFISEALRDPNSRVLIHCIQGVSRSPSVVAAYLMKAYGWSSTKAVQFLKSKRRVYPNTGFLGQLREYEKTIR